MNNSGVDNLIESFDDWPSFNLEELLSCLAKNYLSSGLPETVVTDVVGCTTIYCHYLEQSLRLYIETEISRETALNVRGLLHSLMVGNRWWDSNSNVLLPAFRQSLMAIDQVAITAPSLHDGKTSVKGRNDAIAHMYGLFSTAFAFIDWMVYVASHNPMGYSQAQKITAKYKLSVLGTPDEFASNLRNSAWNK